MFNFPLKLHAFVFTSALILIGISIPFSVFTLSVFQIVLAVNWVVEGDFLVKWNRLKQRRSLLIIGLFYLVHLAGMLYTSNFSWGFHDLRIKLPFFVFPLVIGTSTPLNKQQLKLILNFFLAAVVAGSMYSAYIIFGFDGKTFHSVDEIFPFVSHIRWSLMVDLGIFIIFWLFNQSESKFKWVYAPALLWLLVYVFLLHIMTGLVVLFITTLVLLIRSVFRSKVLIYRWFVSVFLITILLLTGSFFTHSYSKFFAFDRINPATVDRYTVKGNPYYFDFKSKNVENGHYTYLYICDSELSEVWQKRSKLDLEGPTQNKGNLRHVLYRYLTSKGLRKDENAINHLSNKEIRYIEWGITNCIDTNKYALYPIVYKIFWELHNYRNGSNPSGYSVSQRIEFVKTALHIIQNNFWIGVGTGDEPDAFAQQYISDNSMLTKDKRLRTHNQLITFWVTFGFIGFLIILTALIVPPLLERKYSDYLFLIIFVISFLSFLNEDTLETHAGISFVALFYTLFLFYRHESNEKT
jgi:hypothetical protein